MVRRLWRDRIRAERVDSLRLAKAVLNERGTPIGRTLVNARIHDEECNRIFSNT